MQAEKPIEETHTTFSKAKILFYVLAAIMFGAIAYYFSDIKGDIRLFAKVNVWWLVIACIGQIGTYASGAYIYKRVIKIVYPQSTIGLQRLFDASIVTVFVNQTIPSANISGVTFFFNFMKQEGVPEESALSVMLVEMLTFYFGIILS